MPKVVVVGSANVDLTIRVERLPQLGETVSGGEFYTSFGGKGSLLGSKRSCASVSRFPCGGGRFYGSGRCLQRGFGPSVGRGAAHARGYQFRQRRRCSDRDEERGSRLTSHKRGDRVPPYEISRIELGLMDRRSRYLSHGRARG